FNSSQGPNTEADEKSAYNNVQVGDGPQHREFRKEILQAMQVGVGRRNKFCENIISVPLPRTTIKQINSGSLSFLLYAQNLQ
ncbi:hypothetical protein, partial [Staphylococcus aureus]|uniref:hypothetical protein n=1 Tax=Staphylococcus aureus TaxID=1280 RepID=UPI001C5B157C